MDAKRTFAVVLEPEEEGGDLKRGTLRGIIAQAGMTVAEFLPFL
jgi:hypothetical protein